MANNTAGEFYKRYNLQFKVTDLDIEKQHTERINNYTKFWKAYRDKAARLPDSDDGTLVTADVNYNRVFVDALVHFMAGKGIRPYVPYNQVLQDFINKVWDLNNKNKKAKDIVRTGKVAGDVFVKVIPYVDTIGREVTSENKFKSDNVASADNAVKQEMSDIDKLHLALDESQDKVIDEGAYVLSDAFDPSLLKQEILILDEKRVFPTYAYTPRKEMVKCEIFMDGVTDDGESFTLREIWTKTTVTVKKNDEVVMGYPAPNYLGYIPVSHIANTEKKNNDYGESDIEKTYNLNYIYNDVMRDIRGIVRYFASPMTVLTGASLKSMIVGPDKTYAIPKGADLKHVTLDTDLPAATKFLELIKEALHEKTGVHARSLGGTANAISNTSGAALHTEYYSLIRATDLCKDNYKEGFKKLNRIIIGYGFLYNGLFLFIDKVINRLVTDLGAKDAAEIISKIQRDQDASDIYPMDKVTKLIAALTLKMDVVATKNKEGVFDYFAFMKEGMFAKWVEDMDIGLSYSLPKDEYTEIGNIRDRRDLNLITDRDSLKRLDVDDPDRYLAEIERDDLRRARHEAKKNAIEMAGQEDGGLGNEPPPPGERKTPKTQVTNNKEDGGVDTKTEGQTKLSANE